MESRVAGPLLASSHKGRYFDLLYHLKDTLVYKSFKVNEEMSNLMHDSYQPKRLLF